MITSFPQSSKIFITAGVIILVALALVFFVLIPELHKVKQSQESVGKNLRELSDLEAQIRSLAEVSVKLDKVASEAKNVEKIFPIREESVSLVEALENAVQKASLTAKISITDFEEDNSISQGQTPSQIVKNLNGVEEVPYSLQFTGTYRELIDLFLYLENMPYPTQIVSLTATAKSESINQGKTLVQTGQAGGELRGVFYLKKINNKDF